MPARIAFIDLSTFTAPIDHALSVERRALLVPEIWADVYLALVDELDRSGWDVFTRPPYLHRRLKLALALLRWARDRNFPAAS